MKLKPYPEYKDSGVPWLGKVPKHWEIHRNGNVFQEIVDTNHPDLELLSMTITKGIIRQSSTGRKIRASDDRKTYKRIRPGEMGYNLMNAFFGGIGVSKYEGIMSPAYAVCRPRFQIEPWYYHYLFRSPIYMQVFNSYSYGIMYERNRLYFERFKIINSPLPTIEEQNIIKRFLDYKSSQIASFIRARKRMIELLKEQKQAIINDAVTGKIDVRTGKPYPKYKPSNVEWLGDVPEGWEIRRLRTIATVKASGIDKHSFEDEIPIMLCNYTDVYKNDQITDKIEFMQATANAEEVKTFTIKAGDVLITKDSETWNDIAVPAYVPEAIANVICGYHLSMIRPKIQEVMGKYLYFAFLTNPIADQFWISANGVTRFGLSQGSIKSAFLILPSKIEQDLIVKFISKQCSNINLVISRTEREIALMQEYRTRLIADVVTGKVDVRDIKIPEVAEEDLVVEDITDTEASDEIIENEEAEV